MEPADILKRDLLRLARACLQNIDVDHNYGYGLQQDSKRPFGNSGHRALVDTLEQIGIDFNYDASEEAQEELLQYARELWGRLPEFVKKHCVLVLK